MKTFFYTCFIFFVIQKVLIASTITVTSNLDSGSNTLREALSNSSSGDTINFNLPSGKTLIKLSSHLPIIDKNLTINGTNAGGLVTIDGNNSHPGFFVKDGNVTISDLKIEKCSSQGGRGGSAGIGGGGGMGAGGGIFVNNIASVTLTNITCNECSSFGGSGGNGVNRGRILCGGGGGLGGDGGSGTKSFHLPTEGGGGGGLYVNASERIGGGSEGGDGQRFDGTGPEDGLQDFGGGGGTHSNIVKHPSGDGRFAGGGGGAVAVTGGDGGTGGGGGGGGYGNLTVGGGTGGKFHLNFGGGHGGESVGVNSAYAGGGGGAGVGGALFIREGGTLYFNSDITKNAYTQGGVAGISTSPQRNEEKGSEDGAGIYIMQSGSLILNPGLNETRSIEAQISGQGNITKNGAGTYILRATNNYTGTTTVNNGTLTINGSIKFSTTTVESSGKLSGIGALGPLTVNGIVKPGNSVGTLQINGNYIQNANSTFLVEIEPTGASSKLSITESATINNPSTIEITALSGEYDIDQTYTVLNASGGLSGEYSTFNITNPNELDGGSLLISYLPNAIELTFLTSSENIITTARSMAFISNNILNQVNHFQADLGFEESILRYYQSLCKCPSKKIRPYFLANYLHGHYKTSKYTLASPFSLSGIIMGLDYWNRIDLIIGGFFNYFRGWGTTTNILRSTSNNYTFSFYLQKIFKSFFIESEIGLTYSDIRKARLSNNIKINEAKPHGYGFSFQTRAAKTIKYKKFIFFPNLALRYFYNYIDSYKEKFDRPSRLKISSSTNNILEALISSNISYRYFINSGEFISQFEITYIADLLKEKIFFTSTRTTLSETRNHTIKSNPKNCLKLKTSLDYKYKNCSILNLSYIASFATNQRITNEVHIGYRVNF